MPRPLALAIATLAGMSVPAAAMDWVVDPAHSAIRFEYLRDGAVAGGVFTRFSGQGQFDPADPATARFSLVIDSASIDLGVDVHSAFATSAEWFDAANHPEVTYVLNGLDPQGEAGYLAIGDLTIRGVPVTLRTPVELVIGDETARASGALAVMRRAYGLGVGPSDLVLDIGDRVTVHFDLVARPAR